VRASLWATCLLALSAPLAAIAGHDVAGPVAATGTGASTPSSSAVAVTTRPARPAPPRGDGPLPHAIAPDPVAPADEALPERPRSHSWPKPAAGPSRSGNPELIFTFDDGPNQVTTPKVLDALAAHHVHAIFFLVGSRVAQPWAPAIVARIIREGHIVANHTMHHADLCDPDETPRTAAREIDRSKAIIERAAGMPVAWFREPYGTRCKLLERLLRARHLSHFHWDLDPQEWKRGHRKQALDYIETEVSRSAGRNVLLMHDMKKATVADLPTILEWIDAENVRRAETAEHPIEIVQSYELALERLPAGLVDWLDELTPDPTTVGRTLARVLP